MRAFHLAWLATALTFSGCHGGDAPALPDCCPFPDGGLAAAPHPLAIVGDRVSDRLDIYTVDPLHQLASLSVDENPGFIDEPFDLALDPSGEVLYVVLGHAAGYQKGTLLKLRTRDGSRLGEVTLGQEPSMIALSGDGKRAYVSLFRNLAHPAGPWTDPGALVVVDTAAMQVLASVDVGAAALGIALDEPRSRVWVACLGSNQVALVATDGTPHLDRLFPLDGDGGQSHGVSPAYVLLDGQHAWITAQASGDLWAYDQATVVLARHLSLGSGSFPQRLALVPGGRFLLVAADGNQELAVISTQALLPLERIPLPGLHPQGIAVTPDARWAIVSDEADLIQPGHAVRVSLAGLGAGGAHLDGTAPAAVFPQAVLIVP